MARPQPDWGRLTIDYGSEVVASLQDGFEGFAVDLNVIAADPRVKTEVARAACHRLVQEQWLKPNRPPQCRNCETNITFEQADGAHCPVCEVEFQCRPPWLPSTFIVIWHVPPRKTEWVVIIHGMNTRAEWQERLSWKLALAYGESVPVAIYKYGKVIVGAIMTVKHRKLAKELAKRLDRMAAQAVDAGYTHPPDIIAHSLGTYLLAIALRDFSELKVGRLILTGCILPPDFDWAPLLESRVDAVLNQYGTRDKWARVAEYFIPGSGPAGRIGFLDSEQNRGRVFNIAAEGKDHSDFFLQKDLDQNFAAVWEPFLRDTGLQDTAQKSRPAKQWTPAPPVLQAGIFRWIAILVALIALAFGSLIAVLGAAAVWALPYPRVEPAFAGVLRKGKITRLRRAGARR